MCFLSSLTGGTSGVGARAEASMVLYRTSNYNQAYPAGQVSLPVGSPLYVGVSLEEQHQGFVVVLEDCYASQSSNPDHPTREYLIRNKCVPQFVLRDANKTDSYIDFGPFPSPLAGVPLTAVGWL